MSDPSTLPVHVPLGDVAELVRNAVANHTPRGPSLESRGLEASPKDLSAEADRVIQRLEQLEKADELSGEVFATAQDGALSRLQSWIASGREPEVSYRKMAGGLGLEARFDKRDIGWARAPWNWLMSPGKHPLIPAAGSPVPMDNDARVALLGDWGTGLYGAPVMASTIRRDAKPYSMIVHLGDVYYSGTHKEVQERFLNLWPKRPEAIHRALNSNHEMYSGGHAYFDLTLDDFDQQASYFAHQNDHWTLIGLDVAYRDHEIDDVQVAWLEKTVQAAGSRKVILMSHHQLFSAFEGQGEKLWGHDRFRSILQRDNVVAWYWGHEHRCILYNKHTQSGILGRCLGHGGVPYSREATEDLPKVDVGDGDWRSAGTRLEAGLEVPSALVLEGPNRLIPMQSAKFLPHGYAELVFNGPHLVERILDPEGTVLYEEPLGG